MHDELNALKDNDTFELVPPPKDRPKRHGGKDGVRSTECGVQSAEYGVRSPSFIRLKVELN